MNAFGDFIYQLIGRPVNNLLRGPKVSSLLTAMGVDPRRYWLLMDLFHQLSERGEVMDQLGRNGVALRSAAMIYGAITAFVGALFVAAKIPPLAYLSIFLAMTTLFLASTLISEAGNSLVNAAEAMVLVHTPVNGATYTAAKLSHLLRIVLYLVPGINLLPAFAALFLPKTRWYYPALHLAAALGVGIVVALICCALFGWLLRFIPARRLKAAAQLAGTLPIMLVWTQRPLRAAFVWTRLHLHPHLPHEQIILRGLGIVAVAAAIVGVVFGLRSLSADYLVRVSAMTRGGAHAGSKVRKSQIGAVVARFFGGQPALAGFAFISRMMLRDYQFRRQLLPMLVFPVMSLGSAFRSGWPGDPFSREFSPVHLLPHLIAFLLFFVCSVMPYGNDFKGVWIFSSVPSKAIDGFARGVHATLWIMVVLIPNLCLLPLFVWRWGVSHAALFSLYTVATASVYLAMELRMIENVPFTKQMATARQSVELPVMLAGGIVMAIAVALQYFVLFRWPAVVAITTAVLAIAAWIGTRESIDTIAGSMRFQLATDAGIGNLYKEIAT